MKIAKSLALLAGMAITGFNASAQTKATMDPPQVAQKETTRIVTNVTGITSDEQSKILAVEQDHAQACQNARVSSNGDKDAMKAKKKKLCEGRDAKIKEILTADQYTQYMKMEKNKKNQS